MLQIFILGRHFSSKSRLALILSNLFLYVTMPSICAKQTIQAENRKMEPKYVRKAGFISIGVIYPSIIYRGPSPFPPLSSAARSRSGARCPSLSETLVVPPTGASGFAPESSRIELAAIESQRPPAKPEA
jgi:hypothetical protein